MRFQMWNCIQDLCSQLRNVMAMRAILEGMGVGRSDGFTAAGAALQFMIKDGVAMWGGLLFTSLASGRLGQNLKFWRLFADFINNVGITLEMIAPLMPRQHFLIIICLASVCKALCGIAAGATGAALSDHWGGCYNNAADVSTKSSAQHTVVSILGLSMSLKFSQYARSNNKILVVYGLLTALHMIANYRAMRILSLKSLNLVRFELLVDELFTVIKLCDEDGSVRVPLGSRSTIEKALHENSNVFTQDYIAKKEPILSLVFPPRWRRIFTSGAKQMRRSYLVEMWVSPSQLNLASSGSKEVIGQLMERIPPPYIIQLNDTKKVVQVIFSSAASSEDQARGYFEALLLARNPIKGSPNDAKVISSGLFPLFFQILLAKGWEVKRLLLRPTHAKAFQIRKQLL